MSLLKRFFSLVLMLALLCGSSALAAKPKATQTPPPPDVPAEIIQEIPVKIEELLDLAYAELVETNGANLKMKNKYTKWRNNGEYGWCGGFITWCMLELDIPQHEWAKTPKEEVPGIVHVKEAGVGKLVTGYTRMNRISYVPQKGFIVVFGNANKKYVKTGATPLYHVGLVYDVVRLESGIYRITTIEGNISLDFTDADGKRHKSGHTIRMYTRDYDPSADPKKNLTLVPEEERDREESIIFSYGYTYKNPSMYVNCFLMPWVPGDPALDVPDNTPEP